MLMRSQLVDIVKKATKYQNDHNDIKKFRSWLISKLKLD